MLKKDKPFILKSILEHNKVLKEVYEKQIEKMLLKYSSESSNSCTEALMTYS